MNAGMRSVCVTTLLIAPLMLLQACEMTQEADNPHFNIVEASIPELQAALADGRVTSRELVTQYLVRIGLYDHKLNAAVSINPNALMLADELDAERAAGNLRGPLHGIPVAVKDNIHTATDMPTTGGTLALRDYWPPYDATLVENLKDAGAIILAKSTLTELANWMAGPPTQMVSGYNAIAGQSYNPYDPRAYPNGEPLLDTGGSSSGIGVAANMWAGSVGTDTGGSVMSPTNANMLAGLRPSTGRISRYGIIPVTLDQDTAGPMTKSVAGVAIMLGALEGKEPDPNDPATTFCEPPENNDYTPFLDANALKGARIGIPRLGITDPLRLPGTEVDRKGLRADEAEVMAEAIAALEAAGAVVVDPADFPSLTTTDPEENYALRRICQTGGPSGVNETCSIVFNYGAKRDFNLWIETLGDTAPFDSLTDLRNWNLENRNLGTLRYNQSRLDSSDFTDLEADRTRYESDLALGLEMSREKGIDAVLETHNLDALMFPATGAAQFASRAGYPGMVVPFGMVTNPRNADDPEMADVRNRPFGVSFTGPHCSDGRMLAIAYAFEQATKKRVPPASTP